MRISDTSFLDPAAQADAPRRNRFSVSRTAGTMPVFKPRVEAAGFAPGQIVSSEISSPRKLGFKDLVDVINPLQHIPVIGHLYRKTTGDEISAPTQFIGAVLFGGPLGGMAALTDIAVREQTGKGGIDTMLSMVGRGQPATDLAESTAPRVILASRKPQPQRMAGTMPVWNAPGTAPAAAIATAPTTATAANTRTFPGAFPVQNLAPSTNFALLLNTLTVPNTPATPKIS